MDGKRDLDGTCRGRRGASRRTPAAANEREKPPRGGGAPASNGEPAEAACLQRQGVDGVSRTVLPLGQFVPSDGRCAGEIGRLSQLESHGILILLVRQSGAGAGRRHGGGLSRPGEAAADGGSRRRAPLVEVASYWAGQAAAASWSHSSRTERSFVVGPPAGLGLLQNWVREYRPSHSSESDPKPASLKAGLGRSHDSLSRWCNN